MKRSFIFVISLIMAFVIQAQETNQIDTIGFEGLKRCKRSFLLNCTQCEKGSVYDSAMIAHDIQHIKNTTLFTDVDCRVEERPDGRYLIYELKEKWTLIPSFKAGVSQDRYWFQFGAVDFHFMGSGINLAVFYKYFDRSSFFGHVITPYINRTKWGEAIAFEY
ncbi:MAG: hypothetical protein U9R19_04010, partial [Bacteroidota bacterium]|nr:hypothetical protein [Bacteroidota bacterium]